jgi:hypothetical protein
MNDVAGRAGPPPRPRLIALIDAFTCATILLFPAVVKIAGKTAEVVQSPILVLGASAIFVIQRPRLAMPAKLFFATTVLMAVVGMVLRPLGGLSYDVHMLQELALLVSMALIVASSISMDPAMFRNRLRLLLGAALVNAVVAIVQWAAGDSLYEEYIAEGMGQSLVFRSPGLFGHPLLLGTLLGAAVLILLSPAGREAVPSSRLRWTALVICFLGALTTLNLSTLGATVLCALLLVLVKAALRDYELGRMVRICAGVGSVVVLLAVTISRSGLDVSDWYMVGTRLEEFGQSPSRQVRQAALEALPSNIARHPQVAVFGAGAGAERVDLEEGKYWMAVTFSTFDNSYLSLIWDCGFIGLAGFLTLLLAPYERLRRNRGLWRFGPLTLFLMMQIFVFCFFAYASMVWIAATVMAIPYRRELSPDAGA